MTIDQGDPEGALHGVGREAMEDHADRVAGETVSHVMSKNFGSPVAGHTVQTPATSHADAAAP
jgi:hypothetical protein